MMDQFPNVLRRIEFLTDTAEALGCLDVANVVIQNEKFQIWTGSGKPNVHHYGKWGLVVHTAEVVDLALRINDFFVENRKGVSPKTLFLAALYHDIGKTRDYEPTNEEMTEWTGATIHRRRVYHITRSAITWMESCQKFNVDEETQEDVLHAIIAHHGQREWGSSVAPNTRIAWILHLADSLSARVDDCDRVENADNPAITAVKVKS